MKKNALHPKLSEVMRALALRRLGKLGASGRKKLASKAGTASWGSMTAAERQIEMRRRALVRTRNRAAAARKKRQSDPLVE